MLFNPWILKAGALQSRSKMISYIKRTVKIISDGHDVKKGSDGGRWTKSQRWCLIVRSFYKCCNNSILGNNSLLRIVSIVASNCCVLFHHLVFCNLRLLLDTITDFILYIFFCISTEYVCVWDHWQIKWHILLSFSDDSLLMKIRWTVNAFIMLMWSNAAIHRKWTCILHQN